MLFVMLIMFYFVFPIQKWSLGAEFLGQMIHQRSSTITESHLAAFDSVPGVIYHGVSRTHLFSTLANATNLPTPPLASIPSLSLSLSHQCNITRTGECNFFAIHCPIRGTGNMLCIISEMEGYRESFGNPYLQGGLVVVALAALFVTCRWNSLPRDELPCQSSGIVGWPLSSCCWWRRCGRV